MFKLKTLVALLWIGMLPLASSASAQSNQMQNRADKRLADLKSEISYRIIGGTPAKEGAWPWQVAMYMRGPDGQYNMRCGGSIINPNWVLTAAHCIGSRNAQDYFIVEGTNRIDQIFKNNGLGQKIAVQQVMPHEGYDPKTIENDIALLRLAVPARSQPISLGLDEDSPLERPGQMTTVTGWGILRTFDSKWQDIATHETVRPGDPRYFTDRLMEVDVPIVSEEVCKQVFKNNIDHRNLCAGFSEGGKDSCRGDSGGPLVEKDPSGRFVQIGVVSFGALDCAAKGVYGAYTRVSAFVDWVRTTSGLQLSSPGGPPQPLPPINPPPVEPPFGSDNAAGVAVSFVQGDTLKIGQTAQIRVTTNKSGYLLLVDVTPDRKMTQVFPNARSLSTPTGGRQKSNFVEANRPLLVPNPQNPYEGFEFKTEPPTGEGVLVAILSAEPLTSIPLPDTPKSMDRAEALEYFERLTNELARNLVVQGTEQPRDWSFAAKKYRIIQ